MLTVLKTVQSATEKRLPSFIVLTVRQVVVNKGSAPVDSECPLVEKCKVYEASKTIWDCMLNQVTFCLLICILLSFVILFLLRQTI